MNETLFRRLDAMRKLLRRPTEKVDLIPLIDLAYSLGQSRLGRAGLRRLTEEQLLAAAEHFTRRHWGKNMMMDGILVRLENLRSNPLTYIWKLMGEKVVRRHCQDVDEQCFAAYRTIDGGSN